MITRSGREYGRFSSINSIGTPTIDDLIHFMVTEAEAKKVEANQYRLVG